MKKNGPLLYFLAVNLIGYAFGIFNWGGLAKFAPIFILIAGFQILYFNFYKNLYVFSVNLKNLFPHIYAKHKVKKMRNNQEIIKIFSFVKGEGFDQVNHKELMEYHTTAKKNLTFSFICLLSGLLLSFIHTSY